jgi:hypothetical protein
MNWLNNLVEQYRYKDEIASIFGVILYTEAHANIIKVLRDDDYWTALNVITGPHWIIFSIRPSKGKTSHPPGTMGRMEEIWMEPEENKALLREFELKSTENLPLFIVFAKDEDGEILKHSLQLKDTSIEEAYGSIKEALELVTNAIIGVKPENRKNVLGGFQAVNLAVSEYKGWKKMQKAIKFYIWVKRLIP